MAAGTVCALMAVLFPVCPHPQAMAITAQVQTPSKAMGNPEAPSQTQLASTFPAC